MTRLMLVGLLSLLAWPARAEERWEVSAVSAFQVSGGDSEHIQLGVDGSFAFHPRLRLHLTGSGMISWQTTRNENLQLLLQNAPSTPAEAPVLLRQMLTIGVEGIPLTGQATLLSLPLDLDLFLRLDGGAANSRVELQWPEESGGQTTYGSAGIRPAIGGSVGLRARAKAFVLRLALSTISFPSKLDHVNGCTADDLKSLRGGGEVNTACDANAFTDPRADANVAYERIQASKSSWSTLVMLGLSAGVAF